MTRVRTLAALALGTTLALAAGCGKKTEPAGGGPDPSVYGGDTAAMQNEVTKAEAQKRLKEIGLAMHKFESEMGFLPAGVVGPKGELGLSWRVAILPHLGADEANLYKQFNLKEPWDSEANKKLLAKMPSVFESPGKAAGEGKTHLRSFVGESAFVRVPPQGFVPKGQSPPPSYPGTPPGLPAPGRRFAEITDGTSNTLAVAEAPEAVEWTKPDELPFRGFPTPERPITPPKLGGVFPGGFHALMCDGAVKFFPAALPEQALSAMISVNGGEVLPNAATNVLFPPEPKQPAAVSGVPESFPEAAARKTAVANYQKLVKGMHDFAETSGHLPAGVMADKAVGLSWRVQILPFIGQEPLFHQFNLKEPWDSERNKPLVEQMPAVFASPGKPAPKGHTFVRTTHGGRHAIIPWDLSAKAGPNGVPSNLAPGAPLPGCRFPAGIPDGTSNTILFVEAADAVPWTRPDELFLPDQLRPVGPGNPPKDAKVPALGGAFADGFHAAMADGRVTFYKTGYPAIELAKLLCPNDGWVVNPLGPPDKIGYSVAFPAVAGNPKK